MLRFLLMRIASAIPVLAILSLVTFTIIQAPPGDYADYIRSQLINQGGASFAEADAQAQAYRVEHGLDKPLPVQYLNWIGGIITRGDFGYSLYYNKPVADVVGERLPRTLLLALVCHLLASMLGITFGIWAATRQYTWIDTTLSAISFLGMTVPRFLMALIIVYLLVFQFNVSEIGSFFSPQYGGAPWSWAKFVDLVKHVWPVVAIATFGGLAYNMRVMRGNLLDTLNAQYVETARAKGLTGSAVVMRHAVPNALHPLVMYQGVVLPYMLTGEIETAIIFALPTVGPAIVGSMAVGDVYVTATFMMVLSATLIVGNIIADMMLVLLDPRIRQFGESQMLARDPSPPPLPAEGPIVAKPARGNERYIALVWRRLKRSWTGMAGLWLVFLLVGMAVFAEFLAPMDPKATDVGFAPPQLPSFHDKDGNFTFRPRVYALADSADLDPVTFQPIVGPDYDHPRLLGFFVEGAPYKLFGLIPADRHFFASTDGQPVHFLGTDKFGRDVLSRAIHGSRVSLMIALTVVFIITVIGTTVGMVSGYFGGRFDIWMQRFVELVLAFPQLPLYLALTTLIPVTAPTNVFLAFVIIVMSALGWAQMSREVRGKTLALARIEYVRAAMAVGATDRRIILQHILPNVMSHVIVAVTLAIPTVVLLECFLGFLGFAVKPPLISWGLMLQDTATYSVIGTYPWILSPVGFVLATVFAFNALGDGLRDAVDPY